MHLERKKILTQTNRNMIDLSDPGNVTLPKQLCKLV